MGYIGVCEKPHSHFAAVNVFEQPAQLGVRFEDIIERQRIVHFAVEFQGVDLVMARKTFNGETVFLVVLHVEHVCVIGI